MKMCSFLSQRWSEIFQGNTFSTLKCWLIKIRTFCGNASVLTNLLTKHRHISKLAYQAGFSQKAAQFNASLPTQLLSRQPSSLLGRKKSQAFRFPSATVAHWIKYLSVGWPWACRLFITKLEWSSTLKAGKTKSCLPQEGQEGCLTRSPIMGAVNEGWGGVRLHEGQWNIHFLLL